MRSAAGRVLGSPLACAAALAALGLAVWFARTFDEWRWLLDVASHEPSSDTLTTGREGVTPVDRIDPPFTIRTPSANGAGTALLAAIALAVWFRWTPRRGERWWWVLAALTALGVLGIAVLVDARPLAELTAWTGLVWSVLGGLIALAAVALVARRAPTGPSWPALWAAPGRTGAAIVLAGVAGTAAELAADAREVRAAEAYVAEVRAAFEADGNTLGFLNVFPGVDGWFGLFDVVSPTVVLAGALLLVVAAVAGIGVIVRLPS